MVYYGHLRMRNEHLIRCILPGIVVTKHYLSSLAVEIDDSIDALGDVSGCWTLVDAIDVEVKNTVGAPLNAHSVAGTKSIQTGTVIVKHCKSVPHYTIARHHPRPRTNISHRGWKIELVRWLGSNANFDGSGPLKHYSI